MMCNSSPTRNVISFLVVLSLFVSSANGFSSSTPSLTVKPTIGRAMIHSPSVPQHHGRMVQNKKSPSTSSLNMISWRDPKGMAGDYPDTVMRLAASGLATLATWHAIANNAVAPVLASCATTLAFSLWSPGLGQAAFCGSFAGMSSAGSLSSTMTVGAIAAGLFELIVHRENKWLGLGGRLGFIAFLAANLSAAIHRQAHGWLNIPRSLGAWKAAFNASPWQYAMLCGAIGSVATIALREIAENAKHLDNDMKDPIRAATAVGIVSSLLVGVNGLELDNFGSILVFGGAFTGMSLPSRLVKGVVPGKDITRGLPGALEILLCYAVAGALGGLIHAMTIPLKWWTGGIWGGKAGTCAFVGVLIFRFFEKIVYSIRNALGMTSGSEELLDSIED
eukprot:scaffold8541_cov70-Cylindrotheca_fusiformis.AAC.1